MTNKKRLIIIDSNSIIHRAFHALPPLTTQKGELVNAVYGFLLVFFKAIREFQPDFVAAAFDFPAPTFRHKKYKEYKAKRPPAPKELYQQIPKIKELLGVFGVPIFEKEGFEADDIIGTISRLAPKKQVLPEIETIILSGDLDALQLIDAWTKVYALRKGVKNVILYDEKLVKEKFQGLIPEQILDFKALRGDPSDNIPGVTGIGEKTAIELLLKFGSLDNLYKELEENSEKTKTLKPKLKETLLKYKEYKAKRPPTPEELYQQIPKIKEILEVFNVQIFEKEGFEADDIIGTISRLAPKKQVLPEGEAIILSGDLDTLQLVDKNTKIYLLRKGVKDTILYDENLVKKKYQGLNPEQIIDFKALKGDPSDNIPGVAGIGEKTAIELIKKFGNLENLYQNLEEIKPKLKELLIHQKEQAFLSKTLVETKKNVPIDFSLKKCQWGKYEKGKIIQILKNFEFYSLIARLPSSARSPGLRPSEVGWGAKVTGGQEKLPNKEKIKENLKLW